MLGDTAKHYSFRAYRDIAYRYPPASRVREEDYRHRLSSASGCRSEVCRHVVWDAFCWRYAGSSSEPSGNVSGRRCEIVSTVDEKIVGPVITRFAPHRQKRMVGQTPSAGIVGALVRHWMEPLHLCSFSRKPWWRTRCLSYIGLLFLSRTKTLVTCYVYAIYYLADRADSSFQDMFEHLDPIICKQVMYIDCH